MFVPGRLKTFVEDSRVLVTSYYHTTHSSPISCAEFLVPVLYHVGGVHTKRWLCSRSATSGFIGKANKTKKSQGGLAVPPSVLFAFRFPDEFESDACEIYEILEKEDGVPT